MQTLRSIALGLCCLGAAACGLHSPERTLPSTNAHVAVDVLFSVDGCTMYRFLDGGYHYFARCEPGAALPTTTTLTPVSCGKHCVEDESIVTAISSRR